MVDDQRYVYSIHTVDIERALHDAYQNDARMDLLDANQRDLLSNALIDNLSHKYYNLNRLHFYIKRALSDIKINPNQHTKVVELSHVLLPFLASASSQILYVSLDDYQKLVNPKHKRRSPGPKDCWDLDVICIRACCD